jgi:hypothetical protein
MNPGLKTGACRILKRGVVSPTHDQTQLEKAPLEAK